MKRPIYTTCTLSDGRTVIIHEGKGGDLMDAMSVGNDNSAIALYHLICVLCSLRLDNGEMQEITIDFLRSLPIPDVVVLSDTVSNQLQKL